jgi:thioredoxin 1
MAEIVNDKFETIGQIANRNEFKQYVKDNKYVMVKFSADWCGPCKRIAPLFKDYFQSTISFNKDIKLILVDIDKDSEVSNLLRIRSVPTMVMYVNGILEYTCNSSAQNDVKHFFEKSVIKMSEYKNSTNYFTNVD